MTRKTAVLVDTGPLVALLNQTDQFHASSVNTLKTIRDPLFTVWPVITEAMYLLEASSVAQDGVWEFLLSHTLILLPLDIEDFSRMRDLMHRYRDRQMDLADAALVRVAEREHITTIFTTDQRDFRIYRPSHAPHFRLLPHL